MSSQPLTVKCSFDGTKKIKFPSADDCTLQVLKDRIGLAFGLAKVPLILTWKDGFGDTNTITEDDELSLAIHYFAEDGDPGDSDSSSEAREERIRLVVNAAIAYQETRGTNLSDSSSLAGSGVSNARQTQYSSRAHSTKTGSAIGSQDGDVFLTEQERHQHQAAPSERSIRSRAELEPDRQSQASSTSLPPLYSDIATSRKQLPGRADSDVYSQSRNSNEGPVNFQWLESSRNRGLAFLDNFAENATTVSGDSLSFGFDPEVIANQECSRNLDSGQDIGEIPYQRGSRIYSDDGEPPSFSLPPPPNLSDCSSCGGYIDTIRYICTTCNGGLSTQASQPQDHSSFELCGKCIAGDIKAGVFHAIHALDDSNFSSFNSGGAPSGERLRHAYKHQVWGESGWTDIGYDVAPESKCTFCQIALVPSRPWYKCISCANICACRGCYSRIHEYHPSDPFGLVTPRNDAPKRRCGYCNERIVGSQILCLQCPSVKICSRCEGAGMVPEGHDVNHYTIKFPESISEAEVDAYCLRLGFRMRQKQGLDTEHDERCASCDQRIIGSMYQCANCPTEPTAYNLCSVCEETSYLCHDAMHVFIKLSAKILHPLRNSQPLIPIVYKTAVGPSESNANDPRGIGYLNILKHRHITCDRCMTPNISGVWYRCAHCTVDSIQFDLCARCEEHDTHKEMHVFFVFKSEVDLSTLESISQWGATLPYPIYNSQ